MGPHMFDQSMIYATADIPAYDGRHGYDIKLIGGVWEIPQMTH